MTAAPYKPQILSQLLLLQVLESSATEIDSGSVVRAPLGNGGKSEKGEQTVGGEGKVEEACRLQCNPRSHLNQTLP